MRITYKSKYEDKTQERYVTDLFETPYGCGAVEGAEHQAKKAIEFSIRLLTHLYKKNLITDAEIEVMLWEQLPAYEEGSLKVIC